MKLSLIMVLAALSLSVLACDDKKGDAAKPATSAAAAAPGASAAPGGSAKGAGW